MIAILDACTILNILQSNFDERYILMIEKVYDEIIIPGKVYEEVNTNKIVNLIDRSLEKPINTLIHTHLLKYVVFKEPEDEIKFIIKSLGQLERNGEFYSVGFSLNKSRLGKNALRENLLHTHFITDDLPAQTDFRDFYKINVIGLIMDSVDLVTLFCLKGLIGQNEVIKFCNSLKLLYNKNASLLLQKLKCINDKPLEILNIKERIIISEMISQLNDISDNAVERIDDLIKTKEFKTILKKCSGLPLLIDEFLKSKFREKIPEINRRIKFLKHVYEIDY